MPSPHLTPVSLRALRATLASSAFFCALLPLPAQSTAKLAVAKSAMIAGTAAANRGDLPTARREFRRATELAPQVAATHAALGATLLAQSDLLPALEELTRAHTLTPTEVFIDLNLARTQVALAEYPQAVATFREALATAVPPALSPQESISYATALAATHDLASAQTIVNTALAAYPDDAPLEDALGTLIAQSGQLDRAIPHFERATTLDPALSLPQYHLGVALLALNQPNEALAPLKTASAALPKAFDAQLQYGRALSATHDDPGALAQLKRALPLRAPSTPTDALNLLALTLQASGDPADALPVFAELATSPHIASSSILINYALAKVQTGDATGALPLYAQALALGPDTPTLREDYGAAYLQKQDLDNALVEFRAGLALDPTSAHLHYDTGLAYKLKDNLAAAVPEFQRAAQLDPQLPDPPYTLGIIYMQQGHSAQAAAQLKLATTLAPLNGDAWALLGSVLKDNGEAAAATEALRHAIELQPDQPSLHIQLAALEVQAGDSTSAAAERKIAARLSRAAISRQRASFALRSGRALLAENKLPEAVLQLTTATHADPTLAEPHALLADVYSRQGNAAAAAVERSTALSLQPTPEK